MSQVALDTMCPGRCYRVVIDVEYWDPAQTDEQNAPKIHVLESSAAATYLANKPIGDNMVSAF